jgi:MoxR-like ATPase
MVSKLFEALAEIKPLKDDERFINLAKDILKNEDIMTLSRTSSAKALVKWGKKSLVRDIFLELANSANPYDQIVSMYVVKEIYKKPGEKVKAKIIELSNYPNPSIAIPALDARLKFKLRPEEAERKLRDFLEADIALSEKIEILNVLYNNSLINAEDFKNIVSNWLEVTEEEFINPAYQASQVLAEILRLSISEQISPYTTAIVSVIKNKVKSVFEEERDKLFERFKIDFPPQEGMEVPKLEEADLVLTPKLLADLELLLPAIKLAHPVILVGAPAIGKSALVRYIAAILKRKYDTLKITVDMDASYLVGEYHPDGTGGIIWVPSILIRGAQKQDGEGWFIVLEEVNLGRSSVLERLNTFLDRDGYMEVPERGEDEIIERDENFRLFGTMNPLTEAGTKTLSPAFLNRFRLFWIDEYGKRELVTIIERKYGIEKEMAERLVNFHIALCDKLIMGEMGRGPDVFIGSYYIINLRDLLRTAEQYLLLLSGAKADLDEKIKALVSAVKQVYNIFDTPEDRNKFNDLILRYILTGGI